MWVSDKDCHFDKNSGSDRLLNFADGSGDNGCGEPVAVVAADLILALTEIVEIVLQVLITQACL